MIESLLSGKVTEMDRCAEMAKLGGGIFVLVVPGCPVGTIVGPGETLTGSTYAAMVFGGKQLTPENLCCFMEDAGKALEREMFPRETP